MIFFVSVAVLLSTYAQAEIIIAQGKKVKFHYKLYVNDQFVETTENTGTIDYVDGDGTIIPELARQMQGLRVSDTKVIQLKAEQAYGQSNPIAFREISKTLLPQGVEPREGQVFQFTAENGSQLPGIIWKVYPHTVLVNLNHPLAGQDLAFEVKIVSIE